MAFLEQLEQVFTPTTTTTETTTQTEETTTSQESTSNPQSLSDMSTYEIRQQEEKEKQKKEDKKGKKSEPFDYNIFIQNLQNAGLGTTNIHTDRGETNFAQYGAALSEELQDRIKNSFDCEADYALQQEIARLFVGKGNNVWQTNTFINQLYAMGYTVDVQTIATQYITDWKKGGSSYLRTDGAINVLTISDGKGGEIVIADSNGNGAIEVEELFMNQILENISSDFLSGEILPTAIRYTAGSAGALMSNIGMGILNTFNNMFKSKDKENKEKMSEEEYNELVDSFVYKCGCTVSEAIDKINSIYHLRFSDLVYKGRYKNSSYDIDATSGATPKNQVEVNDFERYEQEIA